MRRLPWLVCVLAAILVPFASIAPRADDRHHRQLEDRQRLRVAQSPTVTSAYLVGEWYTRNFEQNRDLKIFWTVRGDGTLSYMFVTDGIAAEGSQGTWTLEGNRLTERWHRPAGLIGTGTATLERIDDNTMRLTIIDNGHPDYAGKIRVYRRRTGPQVSMLIAE